VKKKGGGDTRVASHRQKKDVPINSKSRRRKGAHREENPCPMGREEGGGQTNEFGENGGRPRTSSGRQGKGLPPQKKKGGFG